MAFALTLFVEAANRRISLAEPLHEAVDSDEICRLLYRTLSAEVESIPAVTPPPEHHLPATLYSAFSTLCSYYDGDSLQAAVCARVLAFHFLMERSGGAALADWVRPNQDTPQFVELHPAVIEAIATVRLHGSVLLRESGFVELVAEKARTTTWKGIQ